MNYTKKTLKLAEKNFGKYLTAWPEDIDTKDILYFLENDGAHPDQDVKEAIEDELTFWEPFEYYTKKQMFDLLTGVT